ncbi:class I SAM-dependent methyltransferase [Nostoc sp. CHAB 5784]|uniref:class I SAM-dependent DNA methyltransferase n=1 Tax=Nostoc mirabile TaxID=2907820 RepID=UPI001E41F2FA|nr:class I SAM-dependent methyltransferase [Nostoc mirabile]MCC5667065.1 class I SAM-dependent methyltransferase [Nostoc mirabile CHAB5784]
MSPETIYSNERYTEYDAWAWLYNETMGPQYSQNQLQPLEKMLLPRLSQNAQLLDLCCGTGHLVQSLIERGYQVTGVDGSEQMLNYARQNSPDANFLLADARYFELPPIFDAVFSTSASLNHIMTIQELQQVFQKVYAALKDGGWFIFDINHHEQMQRWWNGEIAEGEIANKYAWTLTPNYNSSDSTGYFQVTMFQATSKPSSSLLRTIWTGLSRILNLRFLYRWRLKLLSAFQAQEKHWKRMDVRYPVRGYYPEEIKVALQEVGFVDIDICTLEGSTTIDNKHSAYFLCRKPAHI